MSKKRVQPSKLDPKVNLAGIPLTTAIKLGGGPINIGVMYKPSGMKCPECGGDSVREYSGAWTEAAKGEKYVCRRCGLEFSRLPKPFYGRRKSKPVSQIAREKAEDVVLESLQEGKRYDLLALQTSTAEYLKTYFTPKELEAVEVEEPQKDSMFEGSAKPITKWSFDVPKYMEARAESIWWDLDEQGFDTEVQIIEKRRGGNVYEYFRIIARRKPEQLIAGVERAREVGYQIVELTDSRFCIKCYRTFPVGSQAFKKDSELLCPSCESPLRRPFDTRPSPAGVKVRGVERQPAGRTATATVVGTSTPQQNVIVLKYRGKCSACNKIHEVGDKVLAQHTQHACPVCGGTINPA